MTSFFYFMIFLCENEPFQRGWGVEGGEGGEGGGLVENYEGARGSSAPYKNGKSREVAGS